MLKMTRRALMAAVAVMPLMTWAASAEGLISIIVTDPANPYWFTEGEVAKATAEGMGYTANVSAHKGDTNAESTLIDTAITNKSVAIILDPANADGSIGAVKKAIAAGIPVFLVNAEINEEGLAKAQLVSNNAQGAAMGAEQWVAMVGETGTYVELFGNPADNNAATRSNDYETVISQYPDLVKAGKLDAVKVGGIDGSPDAVAAVKSGEMQYTVLQPVAVFSAEAVRQADNFIKTGSTGAATEKQLFDCLLITKDNVDKYTAAFTLSE